MRRVEMPAFTLSDLEVIAREIIGDRDIALSPSMSAEDVPGWDSLNHTLITLEIAGRFGAKIEAPELAKLPDFAAVVALVNERLSEH
jgi:acyl carrier protein